MSNIWRIKCKN